MKPFYLRRRVLLATAAALAAAGVALATINGGDKPAKGAGARATAEDVLQLAAGDTALAQRGPIQRRVDITGTLEAVNQTIITAPVEAEVAEVLLRPGMEVKKGQVLLRFSTTDLRLRLAQQQAQVDAAKAQLQLATTTYEQQKALLARQFISQNAFDNAQSTLSSARSQLKAAEAAYALAREHLDDAAVRAPFNARLAERRVEPGQRVGPNTPLLRLVDTSELELTAAVAGNQVALVSEGQTVQLHIEGMEDKPVSGTVARIAPAADPASRRIPVYVRIANGRGQLRAGLFAHGRITVDAGAELVSVPEAAVHRDSNAPAWVWVVRNGRLQRQVITTGSTDDERRLVAVVQGLQAGERVLTVPGSAFREGQPVTVPSTAR